MKLATSEASALLARLGDPFENPLTYAEEGICVAVHGEYFGLVVVGDQSLHHMREAD